MRRRFAAHWPPSKQGHRAGHVCKSGPATVRKRRNRWLRPSPKRRNGGPHRYKRAQTRPTEAVTALLQKVKRGMSRLIDAYQEGLLEKSEFEPRLRGAKERLARLEAEARSQAAAQAEEEELRLVIGHVQEFTERVGSGLATADWDTRRAILKALVKRVEVGQDQVRVVYRVNTSPFVRSPEGGVFQDCGGGVWQPCIESFRPIRGRCQARLCIPTNGRNNSCTLAFSCFRDSPSRNSILEARPSSRHNHGGHSFSV